MKQLKRIYCVCAALLFLGIAIVAVGLCTLRLLSFSPYMVLTGSMQPQYPIGSLVYVRAVAKQRLKVGDAITFAMPHSQTVVTHAIVAIDAEDGLYYTKGIANDTWDAGAVPYENIIGKVYLCIPYMGYLTVPLASKKGRLAVLLAFVVVWAVVCVAKNLYKLIRMFRTNNHKDTR